jgi:hypothetical protein
MGMENSLKFTFLVFWFDSNCVGSVMLLATYNNAECHFLINHDTCKLFVCD